MDMTDKWEYELRAKNIEHRIQQKTGNEQPRKTERKKLTILDN